MSKFLDKISRDVKNIFVGSHKGDDVSEEWFEEPRKNPLDSMPVANGSNRYAPPERMAELEAEVAEKKAVEENPRPEEEAAQWFTDEEDGQDYEGSAVEEEKTMHQKMYEIATAKYNPFSIGGSERLGGGSEEAHK